MALFAGAATGEGPTPRTPEILNSLMSMTNPFDVAVKQSHNNNHHTNHVPPLQHTRSQLIKEGLKLTLQTKRKSIPASPPPSDYNPHTPNSDNLTPEDEERRRRRRERNKIAATKCRLKKRERTFNLVHESEILETQNMDLKSQIQDLENEKKRLVDMLSMHRPNCGKAFPAPFPEAYSSHPTPPIGGYAKEQHYSKLEISCETTISYHREMADQKWSQEGYGAPQPGYDYGYQGSPADYPSPGGQYPRSGTPGHYPRPASLSTSSSDFDKDVDSPTLNHANYHHFDEESDTYIPVFPMSTVTHS